jgi:mono/diheme cytochrome c family protein
MPSFGSDLTNEEIADILAYLKEGWTTEQRQVQAETSRNWEQYQNSGQ